MLALAASGVVPARAEAFEADPRIAVADSLVAEGDFPSAMEELESLLGEVPDHYGALWRCASVGVALGVVAEGGTNEAGAAERYARAETCADAAVRVRPDGMEGRYWRVAAMGRRALSSGRREAASLGERIRDEALAILDEDPEHAGAHNALGRLYFEIVTLSGVTRFLGRTFLGGRALGEASWEDAEGHLRRAVEVDPDMALFRLDLGRFLARAGRTAEAREELRTVAEGRPLNPADRVFREQAAELLRRIER